MKNFLKNKNTTLIIEDYTRMKRKVSVSILQNSSFFFILYLFYNANLLKLYENVKLRFNTIKFVNDINILTYKESTKRNCEILKRHETKSLNEQRNTISNLINKNIVTIVLRICLKSV